jgi:hypothetical protein
VTVVPAVAGLADAVTTTAGVPGAAVRVVEAEVLAFELLSPE